MANEDEKGSSSRRDVLKLAGAAALGGVALGVVEGGSVMSAGAQVVDSSQVNVTINGVAVSGLVSVVPFESSSTITQQTSSDGKTITLVPGELESFGPVLTRQWTAKSDWLAWRMSVIKGQPEFRDVTVTVLGLNGIHLFQHVYGNCLIAEYVYPELNSHGHEPLMEKVTIRAETLSIQ